VLAEQVLSQLSYTPTAGTTLILKHFRPFQNPIPSPFHGHCTKTVKENWRSVHGGQYNEAGGGPSVIAISRTPLWLASVWGCRGRRPSRG
jgi:hypothetical protein